MESFFLLGNWERPVENDWLLAMGLVGRFHLLMLDFHCFNYYLDDLQLLIAYGQQIYSSLNWFISIRNFCEVIPEHSETHWPVFQSILKCVILVVVETI